jgi:hypothetical protein
MNPERRQQIVDHIRPTARGLDVMGRIQKARSLEAILVDVDIPGVFISQELALALVDEAAESRPAKKTPRKKSLTKKAGKFAWRRLRKYPDYEVNENGQVKGPAGTELKFRWNGPKPYVKIEGHDRAVYWLLVDAGFEEHPAERKARRAAAKFGQAANGAPLSEEEAKSEDPESFDLDPETGEAVQ